MWQKLSRGYPLRLELFPLALLAFTLYLTISSYASLPDHVPAHFNFQGVPDRWGGRGEVIIFPVLSFFLYCLFIGITVALSVVKDPKSMINLPSRMKAALTVAQAEGLRVVLLRSLFALKMLTLGLLAYLAFTTIQVAAGRATSIGVYLLVFVAAILAVAGYMVWRSLRLALRGK